MLTLWQVAAQLQAEGPAVELAQGQQLSLATLSLFLVDVSRPFGAFPTLPNLALSALFRVPAGASLQLTDVVIVLSVPDMSDFMRSVCSVSDTDAWTYNPGVVIDDGYVYLLNHTSRAPSESGVAGEGGEVRWSNVHLICTGFALPPPLPCAARPATAASELGASGRMVEYVEGPIYLSLTTDLALQDRSWEQAVVAPGSLLVLLGDPSLEQRRGRRTTLDLGALEGAWLGSQGATVSQLRDLQLVNLPYSTRPLEPYNLLALGMQSFGRTGSGDTNVSSIAPFEQHPSLRLARCTLVVSDSELAFLSRAAAASASGIGVPNLATLFGAGVPQPRIGINSTDEDQAQGRLALEFLQIGNLVALSNVMLQSASAYTSQPAAATEEAPPPEPLLPSALVWPPLSLYDEEVALQWGAIGRVALSSPITLRDLVLYNLAPGGAYPAEGASSGGDAPLVPAAQLLGANAVWTNSSLPLWFFQCARADEDLQQLLLSSGGQAGVGAAVLAALPPRLVLANISLVVPEAEWRALAAAVLLQHAPYSMQAAQQDPQRQLRWSDHRRLAEAGEALEVQAGASATDALLGFAATSRVASYNYSGGVLVLAEARWYGVRGSDVTVTYKLPDGAPPDATLLPYSGIVLPYQELAGEFGGVYLVRKSHPALHAVGLRGAPPPGALLQPHAPQPPIRSLERLPVEAAVVAASGDGKPAWLVPVVATASALGGVTVLAAALWGVLARRRRRRCQSEGHQGAAKAVFYAAPGKPDPACGSRSVDCKVLGYDTATTSSLVTNNPSTTTRPWPRSDQGVPEVSLTAYATSMAMSTAEPSDVRVDVGSGGSQDAPAHGSWLSSRAEALLGGSLSAEEETAVKGEFVHDIEDFSDSGMPVGQPFTPPLAAYLLAASCGDEVHCLCTTECSAHESSPPALGVLFQAYFGDLRDKVSCGNARSAAAQPPEPLAAVANSGDGAASGAVQPRGRPHHGHEPSTAGAQLLQSIRTLEAELCDPDLVVNVFLGSGSWGRVYGGTWRGVPVAIKMLVVPGSGGDKDIRARQRVALEAAISLSMSHPNVVATYTYEIKPLVHQPSTADPSAIGSMGISGEPEPADADAYKLYIVQELCNGDSLGHALGAGMAGSIVRGGFHKQVALRLAADVALGMAHVHSCRIVHGDLKPGGLRCVLLPGGLAENSKRVGGAGSANDPSGGSCNGQGGGAAMPTVQLTAKVADFGLSLPLEVGATHASRRFHGTPMYSAPEVLVMGRQSPQADVWSFGLLLLELFYGCALPTMKALHDRLMAESEQGAAGSQRRPLEEMLMQELFNSPNHLFAALAASCLHIDPHARPPFEELAAQLLEMCVSGTGDEYDDAH
ncbi:Tyrosine-protein kinase transforming protein Src [Tetrabaena socialis]|uniref:Tyrosine-protein kinase transforming protein Src n=1 Tax=Tetrabaena socialis TaxID=47790 RepID=A0A2J8AA89_9CHLO|nr:Tyrosine-protein kinase transforming protein Src [Tetrabaena socialis]|eukprot:PNH09439.1 Tyrosine-protein kinase transforming protein Src [Tetrabaena socialis]